MSADSIDLLVRAVVAVTVGLCLVLALRVPARRLFGARLAYAAWALVPLCVLAVLLPAPARGVLDLVGADAGAGAGALPALLVGTMPPGGAAGADLRVPILLAWFAGVIATALLFAWRQRRFERAILRRPGAPWDLVVAHGPAVTGLLRPRILLPADFEQRYSAGEQALVLAHERLHVQRGDVATQALATALRCLFWFHPLVHAAASAFRFDQELACDADVLARHPDSRRAYGDAMLKTQLADFGLPVGCHWQSSHPLKERVAMLKQPHPGILRRLSGRVLVASLVGSVAFATWAAQPGPVLAAAPSAKSPSAAAPAPYITRLTPQDEMASPAYPKDALSKGLSGNVTLEIFIDASGQVTDSRIVSSTPSGVFDAAAIAAASSWHFRTVPVDAGDKPPRGWMRTQVEFRPDGPPPQG